MKKTEAKQSVYQIVTEKIISRLERGVVPWRKPWAEARAPFNLVTKKPYRGINSLLLGMEDYATHAYLSFNQLKEKGGSVLKGEKAHLVVFWSAVLDDQDKTKEPKRKTILRYYKVFNVAQCANLPASMMPGPQMAFDPVDACEEVVYHMPKVPRIEHGGSEAFYSPVHDFVNMPARKFFNSPEGYYATLFHELVHSTGHESRLARKEVMDAQAFGSEAYSKEELVAEMGAGFLGSMTGIAKDDFEANAAYIQSWLRVLKGDPKLVIYAGSQAQKAVDYILGMQLDKEKTDTVEKEVA